MIARVAFVIADSDKRWVDIKSILFPVIVTGFAPT